MKYKLAGLALVVGSLAALFSPAQKALAWTMTGTFVDRAHWQLQSITFTSSDIGGVIDAQLVSDLGNGNQTTGLSILNSYVQSEGTGYFFDGNSTDTNEDYEKASCNSDANNINLNGDDWILYDLFIDLPIVGCKDVISGWNLTPLPASATGGNRFILYAFTDADTIVRVDGLNGNFELTDPTNFPDTYFSGGSEYVRVINGTVGQRYEGTQSAGQYEVIPFNSTSPWVPPGGGAGGGGGNNQPLPPSCSNSADGGPLRWILCPTLALLDKLISTLEEQVEDLLYVRDPNSQLAGEATDSLKTAWGRFRNIALIILIPIMLVMIIGTAVGASAFDAYTVKRAMPRFLIAIVFISVSWYITSFFINLTNVVGTGIQGLMLSPFQTASGPLSDSNTLSELLTVSESWQATGAGLGIFAAIATFGGITTGVVISFAAGVALAMFIGWFLLTIRQMLIYALVLMAPIAILSWIFPNNDKLWKIWWGTFTTLLLMFPILMIVISATRIFAYVIGTSWQ